MKANQILHGNCFEVIQTLSEESVHTCVTSPPYWGLRDYGIEGFDWPAVSYVPMAGLPQLKINPWHGQLGHEPTPEMFVAHIVLIFREVWRVLRRDGTIWINFGDSYISQGGHTDKTANDRRDGYRVSHRPESVGSQLHTRPINGLKVKDLVGMPWRIAFALQADGWYLRQDLIWAKPNPMPESVRDRCTKAHEYLFLFSKASRYYFDKNAIAELAITTDGTQGFERENGKMIELRVPGSRNASHRPNRSKIKVPSGWDTSKGSHGGYHKDGRSIPEYREVKHPIGGIKYGTNDSDEHRTASGNGYESTGLRNKRSVWTVATQPYPDAHFATFPARLIEPCILAGCPEGGTVLDPFGGSGTTGEVAAIHRRNYILIEANPEYLPMIDKRIRGKQIQLL